MNKKVPILPNVITAFALSCGLFVIFKVCMVPNSGLSGDMLIASAAILLLAAFADLLDGAVARAMKAESEFGGLFDSLADAITFGVAPSVIAIKTLSNSMSLPFSFLITTAAMVYSVCGILRLARYNVMALGCKENVEFTASFKKNFTGLPIPAAASAVVSLNLLLASEEFHSITGLHSTLRPLLLIFAMIFVGYLMISRWKFPSFKRLHIRVASFQTVFLTVLFAVIIFYGLLHHFVLIFFAFSWLYLLVAAMLSIIRLISGRKSNTLEDFEPESDPLDEGAPEGGE